MYNSSVSNIHSRHPQICQSHRNLILEGLDEVEELQKEQELEYSDGFDDGLWDLGGLCLPALEEPYWDDDGMDDPYWDDYSWD